MIKHCPRCGEDKDTCLFYTHKGGKPHSYCKECDKELKKDYERRNKDRISLAKKARFALVPWANNSKYVRKTSRRPFWEKRMEKEIHAAMRFFAVNGCDIDSVPRESIDAYLKMVALRRLIKVHREARNGETKKR